MAEELTTLGQHMDPVVVKLWELQNMLKSTGVTVEIQRTLDEALDLFFKRERCCEDHTSPASLELQQISHMTFSHPWEDLYAQGKTLWSLRPFMMVGFLEGQFLKFLVSMSNAKRVLEIGTFTGYTALAFAEALPEEGEVITCEFDPYLENLVKEYTSKSVHGRKISIRIGPALETINKLADDKQSFDIIFLDANKDQYWEYYQVIMDRGLLAPRGTIVVDNALFQGQVYCETKDKMGEGMKAFNENLSRDTRVKTVLVPIRDGVRLIRRIEDMLAKGQAD
ncbi:hypothetical protein CHS0354_026883 [Potamilus streckersoni]|uniref:Caffeoyl-CoA O-methyltransferase n=1 Tax=Potamilus streckersoni TaxID=2493646 RepID=A0AAE0VZL1_9BIVA|nr:hypothetical protein CHS0354_026883 [Potamilus streckersoni]